MVRIQVIKASKLAVAAALILLVTVLALMLWSRYGSKQEARHSSAEAVAAFAASLPLAPGATRDGGQQGLLIDVVTAEPPSESAACFRVLIYHTHTYEAYEQVADDAYQETESWRTADPAHSVVRVGEALSELLTSAGCEVTHDTTDHELPDLRTAYSRSLETLLSYEQPFDLYIDLHRDAYSEGAVRSVTVDGQSLAPIMLMVGRGDNYQDKPDFAANYAFAARVTRAVNEQADGLCRDVLVRSGRYNQQIGSPAVLIEVGHNKNTLQEALASLPYLADGLTQSLAQTDDDV